MNKRDSGQMVARWIGYAVIIIVTAWITATIVGYLTGAAANMIV